MAVVSLACVVAPTPTPAPEPRGGDGEFRVAYLPEPTTLNPDLKVDDGTFAISQNIYNKLVTLDANYQVIPDLAQTWTVSADGLAYTFTLAPGARWHDGQPCTAADVKWTLETITAKGYASADVTKRITAIEAPNDTTVVLRLQEPWSPMLSNLAWYGTFILPKHVFGDADWATHAATNAPVGTGPFRVVEWQRGERMVLEANKSYFRRGPFVDRVVYVFPKAAAQGGDMLAAGEVDYTVARPTNERIKQFQATSGIVVRSYPNPSRYFFGFNLTRKPLDDVRVRRALNAAIDRDTLIERALGGYGDPGMGMYTPAVAWAYNQHAIAPDFDRQEAGRLLDEAGLRPGPDGVRLRLQAMVPNLSPFSELAAEARAQLREVGVDLGIESVPAADAQRRMQTTRDFDVALNNGSHGPDPDNLAVRFGSSSRLGFTGYSSAEFDEAIAQGARLVAFEQRAPAYFRAQALLARDLPLLPLVENVQFVIYRERVSGLPQVEGRGLVTFQDYSLVRLRK